MATLEITLNGEPYEVEGPISVGALLERLGIDPRTVAVELNEDIVIRHRYAETMLSAGDTVEVVRMIGGGRE